MIIKSHLNLDLASSTSTSMSLILVALLLIDLEPRRQRSADLKIERDFSSNPRQYVCIVFAVLYGYQFCESAVISLTFAPHTSSCGEY